MKISKKLLYLTTLILLPYSCINNELIPTEEVVTLGDTLPDFTITMNDGKSLTGETLRNSTSVVMFFHTNCPDCQQVLPHVQRLYDVYAQQGVAFALISREESATSVSSYWTEQGFTMPYSAQANRKIYELFAYRRVPRIYISEQGGTVRYLFTDNPPPIYDTLNEAIGDVLNKF